MIKKTLKKLGLPMLALAGMLMFVGTPKANAGVHFGIGIGVPAYPYAYGYPYAYPGYYPYAYPYAYGYGYPYYGGFYGGYWGGGWVAATTVVEATMVVGATMVVAGMWAVDMAAGSEVAQFAAGAVVDSTVAAAAAVDIDN